MHDLDKVLESGRAIEREVCSRSGRWFFMRILPYKARLAIDGVVLTLIDIGALKAAENAVFRERYLLNSLMDAVPDWIYFRDAAGKFVRLNRAMAARLGIEPSEKATGKTASDFLPEVEARPFDDLDRVALDGEPQPYREEQYTIHGAPLWFMATRQPLRDRGGAIVGMLGVARDITEQKRAEDEIRLAVKRRDVFLAMLSHELRNPLGAIVSAAAYLKSYEQPNSAQTRGLMVIERQSQQMARLLDDLLEVSRITQNKIQLKRRVVDARLVLSDAVVAVRDRFEARRVALAVNLGDEPAYVEADPARLQQIAVNLLDNAAKYNRPGGHAQLSLRCEADQVVFAISDDGSGIEAGALSSIFQPFVQGMATIHRTDGGMGVGLSVVRSLVEMHGGRVEAKSSGLGQGSEFIIRLPLAGLPEEAPSARSRPVLPPGSSVVVVEDNPDGCEMLKLLLEQAGHQVFTAPDGETGLAVIKETKPKAAIVDIGLPILDGFELARQLRELPECRDLFLIALTGYGQTGDRANVLAAGFDEHWVKPLHPDDFARWLVPETSVRPEHVSDR